MWVHGHAVEGVAAVPAQRDGPARISPHRPDGGLLLKSGVLVSDTGGLHLGQGRGAAGLVMPLGLFRGPRGHRVLLAAQLILLYLSTGTGSLAAAVSGTVRTMEIEQAGPARNAKQMALVGRSTTSSLVHPVMSGVPSGEVRDTVLLTAACRLMSGIIRMLTYNPLYFVE